MRKTKLREGSVHDEDFASEVEMEEAFVAHVGEYHGLGDGQRYYIDEVRGMELEIITDEVVFYKNYRNVRDIYIYNTPNVVSSIIPFTTTEKECVIGYKVTSSSIMPVGTEIDIRNAVGSVINIVTTVESKTLEVSDLTIILEADTVLKAFIGDIAIDTPIIQLFKKGVNINV